MVREIIKDPTILGQKSEPFIFGQDDHIIQDMLDTAKANIDNCAGLAAIQIGEPVCAILVRNGSDFKAMLNPKIIKKSPSFYWTMEGCLSVDGEHRVKRHRSVLVSYMTKNGKQKTETFTGYIAQIIQHEVDHLNGVLI